MKPLTHGTIRGSWTTLLLPLNEDDSIDYALLSNQIETLIAYKVSGIYCNGTAGEFYNLREAEFDKISEILADACNRANMPFQIGVSHMSPLISYERLKRCASLAPGAVQVILPDWVTTSMDESIAFLRKMSEYAMDIPLVLYNPPHAKHCLSPEEFALLKGEVPSLAGIKVGSSDAQWFQQMKAMVPDLSVFIPGHTLATGIQMGAQGAYSNVACLNPLAAQKWYEIMMTDIEEALRLEIRIKRFLNDHIRPFISNQKYSNQAVDKLMTCVGGWTPLTPRLRWPYKGIDVSEVAKLRAILAKQLPEFIIDASYE